MNITKIQWTDVTWNPVVGCTKVSAGCKHCYAKTLHDKRHKVNDGEAQMCLGLFEKGERRERHDEGWPEWVERVGAPPEGWASRARDLGIRLPMPAQYDQPFEVVQLMPERLEAPLHWRKPRRVFVNSVSDLFHEDVPVEFIDRVFAVMALTPQHTYQVLTKRPERMREYLSDMGRHYIGEVDGEYMERWGDAAVELTGDPCSSGGPIEDCGWPIPNVWLGTSVEDQSAADQRIPELLATPAAVRFLSCEPLLAPVLFDDGVSSFLTCPGHEETSEGQGCGTYNERREHFHGIDWVIVGGESGPGARPCDLAWIRGIVAQCRAASVPVFCKQGGSSNACRHDRKGGHFECFPDDLQVREWPDGTRS